MSLSHPVIIAISLLVAAAGWFFAPAVLGRSLAPWEALVPGGIAFGLLHWLRGRNQRRQRQVVESMRDSALW